MKIVCESCGAKYSIADEKVAGKVFKIRCKKCSAVIVVKGDQQSASAGGAPQALDAGGEAVWHVVVGGDQQGPFAPRQIGELLAEGKIDWEAYVWREGMDGWQPAKDVPQLVSAVMAESESGEAGKPAGGEPLFGGSGDMGADPFASGDDGGLSGVIGQAVAASASPVGGGADLFADSGGGAFGGGDDDDDGRLGAPGPRVGSEDAMTGQRNENSVLFSLSNLQALATGSGGAPAAGSGKPGMAGGEGSGLIDIRALASATQTVGDRSASTPRSKVDDLLAVGSTGTAFSATSLAAPVAVEKRDTSRTMLYFMAAAIVLLGGALAFLVARPGQQPTAQLTPATEAPAPTGAATPTPAPVPTQPTAAPQAAEPAAEPAPTPSTPSDEPSEAIADEGRMADDEPERSGRERRHRDRDRDRDGKSERESKSDKSSSATAAPAATEPEKPERKAASSGDKSLDDLLDTALSGKPKAAGAAKPAENLPATPSRDDVLAAMKSVTTKVQGCGQGQSGVAMTKVNVAGPTGKVTGADVSGQFAGTPVGACISKEVAKAKFSKFSQSTFSFSYPFKL